MGEHDVLVKLEQIKLVNEPMASAVANTPAKPVPANTTGTGTAATPPAATTPANQTAETTGTVTGANAPASNTADHSQSPNGPAR